ncbi:endonuclease (plasmid) [Pandoraea faecigallinarum]|uniref:phospholipase D n=1 Tax=Pandoraea faecigallinarum TaxID=656179 RepID=A0A0H3X3C6_9BURK|nr:phospholipase D family protein [Pandoraea faecigallinarum]AKM33443.1 endonuclease [Pandoraea faecigallinarum]
MALATVAGAEGFTVSLLDEAHNAVAAEPGRAARAPTTQVVEVGFSPEAGAEALVLKVIAAANTSIRLAGYSFTSPTVVRALLDAKQRGVDVAVVVDDKGTRSTTSRQALNLLVNAGIPTRTVSVYAIHHDKYIVIDGLHVETGSFNYTASAATRNSENVLVLWNYPTLAAQYLAHWQSRWEQGQPYQSSY